MALARVMGPPVNPTAAESRLTLEDWQNFGVDYDRTLMAWHANISAHWDDLPDTYDERFRRMWNYYLLVSAGGFRSHYLQLWQVVFSRDIMSRDRHVEHVGSVAVGSHY